MCYIVAVTYVYGYISRSSEELVHRLHLAESRPRQKFDIPVAMKPLP